MDRICFTINGRKYSAGSEVSVDTTLNEYIRRRADLRGTKYMCLEGGCGACVLNVRARRPGTGELATFSVNSCLVAVLSCEGWDITTIEGIGSRQKGYNIIQTRLNNFFGSQCGYCSPGFVMSMYSLIHSSEHHLTEEQIEKSFGSNLCRCTGYRPILEAFKSFAVDPDPKILKKIKDIEDIDNLVCPKSGKMCGGPCESSDEDWCVINAKKVGMVTKKISLSDGKIWFLVNNVKSIFEALDQVQGYDNYMVVAGNTSRGAYPIKFYPKVLIDISGVAELRTHYLDVNLVLGANTTLTDTINLFDELSKTYDDFWYLKVLRRHLEVVAHIPVRNIGTLAGNLILKHEHPDFQSDVFLLFSCVGAIVTLVDRTQQQTEMSLPEFLTTDIVGKVMTTIKLPPLSRQNGIVTYKIRPKAQNAHAEVNGAFLFKFDKKTHKILTASIVYGGINPTFTHAYNTEQFLIGRDLFTNETLQGALHCLEKEVDPDLIPPEPQPRSRKKMALALFYKAVIKLCPRHILNPIYACGATLAYDDRPPVSRSYQEYDTKKAEYPITQPLLKKEGLIQCAGEAKYNDDIPTISKEVFVSFVLSTIARGEIESVDGTDALKIDGVIAVYTSKDIPGINTIGRGDGAIIMKDEELLASDKIFFFNQPVALVVAETQVLADQVAYLVKVKYKNIPENPIILTIQDGIDAPPLENRLVPYPGIEPTDRGLDVQKVIKGRFYSPRQYHHMMELHTTVTRPVDNGYEVDCSAQWQGAAQAGIALLLNIPYNKIVVRTRRCGGGFGSKIFRHTFAAAATALVAYKLNRPCRMAMHMRDIMRVIGKRPDSRLDYEVGVNSNGQIQYMDATFYVNDGMCSNENENSYAIKGLKNCYNSDRWKVATFGVITDAATNCFMRAPGDFEGTTAIEHIMERIAHEIKKDPIEVRFNNYRTIDNQLPDYISTFLEKSDYNKRLKDIKEFNAKNRWKKRGLRLNNMSFQSTYFGNYSAVVSVYHGDGSVIINAGSIEIGQGINTKLAQVAAFELKIPVDKVEVAAAYEFATPNCYSTASSITTECVALCVIRSCEQILARLAPVRAAMPDATWEEVVMEADLRGILLQANAETSPNDPRLRNYYIFGVAATEVEVDVLTGTKYVVRADILEDIGNSLNPALDVGQVKYKNIPENPIILTIQDGIDAPPLENRLVPYPGIEPTDRGLDVQKVIKGRFYSPRQYHHMMELHTTVTRPVDNGYEVDCSAQWQGAAQAGIALLLNIPYNKIVVRTRRCGGGFGSKIFRHTFAAAATALVAYKLNRPCRMAMHMRDIMRVIGKRPDSRLDYEVGVNSNGQIQYMDATFYVNDGMCSNENENSYAIKGLKNCYNSDRWKVATFGVITDAATNCFMRAPGDFEGTTAIEHIMERIAHEIKKDPIEVRFNNYRTIDNQLPDYISTFLEKSDYNKRLKDIKEFNAKNRWKKRGLRLNNMSFQSTYFGNYSAVVSVYHGDGSVIINAGSIEIGQGINTKLAQVAAFELKIPVDKVEVAAAYEFATPNCYSTASSITTECVALCVIRSCEQILARLAPVRAAMPDATWEEVVMEADLRGILLQANAETSPNDPRLRNYYIFGVAATEVEVDVLTGTKYVVRADILEDIGNSLNPALDVGQVEGAFVQCLSAWLMEEIVYNHHNGEIYTDRTWNYHIMGAKDIPWDYRVYLSRNRPNPVGILGSKAVGEPPCTLTYCVVDALRAAIQDSRRDSGYDTDRYLDLDVPVTNESVVDAAEVKISEFLLY